MKKQIFLSAGLLVCCCIFYILACSKGSNGYNNSTTTPPGNTANTVDIKGMAFGPTSLTVKAGTTVVWENSDNMAHTVTADDNSFDSGNVAVSTKYSHTFSSTGSFPYHCNYHSGMKGTIVVN